MVWLRIQLENLSEKSLRRSSMESKAGHSKISAAVLMAALLGFLLVAPGPTLPQTPFFQGKTITIVQGRDPGGTGGDPEIIAIFKQIAGAGSLPPR
jgi:hypothetical protein